MFSDLFKNYVYPMAVFAGGMIGVGFLSLPYIALQVGIWTMLLYFLVMTGLMVAINLIFCQISLKTPDFKRFPGFVEHYLGKPAKFFAMLSMILGTFGTLLVYLLVGGQFLTSIFQPFLRGNMLAYVCIYFLIASIIIYFDIKVVAKAEFWVIAMLFLAVFLIFASGFSHIKISNILISNFKFQISNLFLPFAPLLFAFWGLGLIPEVEEMLGKGKKRLKKIVAISTVVVSVFYFLFVILILGISGQQTSPTALGGLGGLLPGIFVPVSLFIGALATFTAFISQGIIFKKTLVFDFKIKHWQAFVMTCCPPFILLLLGFNSFISIISFIGGVLLGINGILIMLMYKKIGGKSFVIYPLTSIFLLGIIYEIIYFIK